ncbi:MAG: alpha-mannosidase [Actinobacteria bacterium]|nr:alpha-mannosidase [Actinomycetota bacterium]
MSGVTSVSFVPHTHWDREWHLPFQTFRLRLVDLLDRLLDLLDADPRFVFTLDGQLAAVDDYLEVRPEAEARLRAHVATGRLAIGPWQVLMDEFLVSGETIVRNLESGWRRGEELGGVMRVGYLPDMFGHIAQMPQILQRAGIEHAAVWRGVPAAVDTSLFRWLAPDGSAVLAEYLVHGYWGAAYVLAIPERFPAKLELLDEDLRPFLRDRPILAMYGTDHSEPLPEAMDVVEELNASQARYRVHVETLAAYFDRLGEVGDSVPAWHGELRSSARANMLMGVNSARIDVKEAAARAERLLERYAEPLQALSGDPWPTAFLRLAWDRVVANSAHDSICGCSADAVNDQVLLRYAEAEQIAQGLTDRAAARIGERVARGSVAVLNPSPEPRQGLVECEFPIPDEWDEVLLELPDGRRVGTQEVSRSRVLLSTIETTGSRVPEFFRRIHGRELFGRWLNSFALDRVDGARRLTFEVDEEPDPAWLDVDEVEREIELAARSAADEVWEIRVVARPRRRLLAAVPAPALGWASVRPLPGSGPVEAAVSVDANGMRNGLLDVGVAADGTLRLSGDGVTLEGVGRLVDGGDFGDSYNYAPPASDLLVSVPEDTLVEVRAAGPVRGLISVVRTYLWPVGVRPDGAGREAETRLVQVTTELELRAGEPFVRVRVSFDNLSRDHRLRFHVPLARAATGSAAEGQFAVVERGLAAESGHGEVALPTFPARGFVDAGGVALLLDHVLEYEVVDGEELALTVLRSTGFISRNINPFREEPAGPEIEIPGAQSIGAWSVGFAVFPHGGSWSEADVLKQMERYQHPFVTAAGTGGEPIDLISSRLELSGTGVTLSSLRRRDEWLELRVVAQRDSPVTALVIGDFSTAREADLLGRAAAPLPVNSGRLELNLAPWEIRTVQLRK